MALSFLFFPAPLKQGMSGCLRKLPAFSNFKNVNGQHPYTTLLFCFCLFIFIFNIIFFLILELFISYQEMEKKKQKTTKYLSHNLYPISKSLNYIKCLKRLFSLDWNVCLCFPFTNIQNTLKFSISRLVDIYILFFFVEDQISSIRRASIYPTIF